jgi:deoxyhypusine synthase
MSTNNNDPTGAQAAVFVESVEMPKDALLVEGPDFNKPLSLHDLLHSYKAMGFQASSLGEAMEIVEKMASTQWLFSIDGVLFD